MTGYSAGSSVNRIGSSVAQGTIPSGLTTIIAAGANLNGVLVRTVLLSTTTAFADLATSDGAVFGFAGAGASYMAAAPLLIPAGKGISLNAGAAGGPYVMSYDIL